MGADHRATLSFTQMAKPKGELLVSLLAVLFLLASAVVGCGGGKSSCSGAERCACYPNATCNTGLTCLSNVCVNSGNNGAGGAGAGGSGAGGGAGVGDAGVGGAGVGDAGVGGAGVGGAGGGGAGTGGGMAPGTGGNSDGGLCRVFEVRPEATVPTVYLLVDRSGSMFQCLNSKPAVADGDGGLRCDPTDNTWSVLKTSVLQTVQDLQSVIRFGFGAFAGEQGGTCPDLNQVPSALSNYNAIATLYNGLPAPTKGETPTSRVLATVRTLLAGDPSPGPKYVLFVTDGEPDYCDDSNALCAIDSAVWQLQLLRAAGVPTFVFGIQSTLSTISGTTLQAFANAGANAAVAPLKSDPNEVFYECQGNSTAWKSDWMAAGRTGMMPIATYTAGGGNARLYRPDPTNPQALTDLLSLTISGVKSCTFDLANGLSVDLGQLGQVKVIVEGQNLAHDASNGWTMASETRLVLAGTACDLWRKPATRSIDFQFPCGVVR